MPFLCPVCKTPTMESSALEDALQAERCANCGGHWITAARYFAYLALTANEPETPETETTDIADSRAIKLCPACGKFMHYYAVGHDLAFGIDKCNTCGGVWLDAGQWRALAARGLKKQLHAISSDAWQADIQRRDKAQTAASAMARRLGPDDYAELQRITAWMRGHPHRAAILAHLQQDEPRPGTADLRALHVSNAAESR